MKIPVKIFLIVILILSTQQVHCQIASEQTVGSWLGTLDAGGVQLRLVFNISITEDALLEATMDSPDQGAKDIPMGDVTLTGDSLRIEAPMIMGYYVGKITSSTTIQGEWNQGGRSFELNLEKQTKQFVLKPFPGAPTPFSLCGRRSGF